jgi:Flp pilus assembly pilin Flp
MLAKIRNFLREEEGAETVEWIFVVALLVLGLAAAWAVLGGAITDTIQEIADALGELPTNGIY